MKVEAMSSSKAINGIIRSPGWLLFVSFVILQIPFIIFFVTLPAHLLIYLFLQQVYIDHLFKKD